MARSSPYKDFLQPALQRRFIQAMGILLLSCYAQALILGNWPSSSFWWFFFWVLFPFGPIGLRTLFLFFCGLSILICRVAHYHVGIRSGHSPIKSFRAHVLSWQTVWCLFYYTLSSVLFSIIYILSAPERAGLQIVSYTPSRRAILNERPVFFFWLTVITALLQAGAHRIWDYDRLDLSRLLPRAEGEPDTPRDVATWLGGLAEAAARKHLPDSAVSAVKRGMQACSRVLPKDLPHVLISAGFSSIMTVGFMVPVYTVLLRGTARAWSLALLRPWYNLPRSNTIPSGSPLPTLFIIRCAYAVAHLLIIWQVANRTFASTMVQQPVKNNKPLTSDSKDMNGTLISGLKAKKLSHKSFAMWELRYITDSPIASGFSEKEAKKRRLGIYDDIDRKEGPMWAQVFAICNDIIKSTETRIDEALTKPEMPLEEKEQDLVRVGVPIKEESVAPAQTPRQILTSELGNVISNFARSPGHTPASRYAPYVRKAFNSLEEKTLGQGQIAAAYGRVSELPLLRIALRADLKNSLIPETWPLYNSTYAAQFSFTNIVLGSPFAEKTLYINAAYILSNLAVHSLTEDQFGNVHRDVAALIRTLTNVITKVKALRTAFVQHNDGEISTPEVDAVLSAYRAALRLVVGGFERYQTDLKLTELDMKSAREAAEGSQQALVPVEEPKQPEPVPNSRVHERASERVEKKRHAKEKEPSKLRDVERRRSVKKPEMEEVKPQPSHQQPLLESATASADLDVRPRRTGVRQVRR